MPKITCKTSFRACLASWILNEYKCNLLFFVTHNTIYVVRKVVFLRIALGYEVQQIFAAYKFMIPDHCHVWNICSYWFNLSVISLIRKMFFYFGAPHKLVSESPLVLKMFIIYVMVLITFLMMPYRCHIVSKIALIYRNQGKILRVWLLTFNLYQHEEPENTFIADAWRNILYLYKCRIYFCRILTMSNSLAWARRCSFPSERPLTFPRSP